MAHAQAWMTALFQIHGWSAESKNKKIPKALFSSVKIVRRVERSQHVVAGNLPVKSGDEAFESLVADGRIDLLFLQQCLSVLPWRQGVLVHFAALHHEYHTAHGGNVIQRIAFGRHQVRLHPWCD